MRMSYKPGTRIKVRRPDKPEWDLDFIILGPGAKPNYKLCKIEYISQLEKYRENFVNEYSTSHLRWVIKQNNCEVSHET